MNYKRFESASEAIRYAIEDLEPAFLYGAVMEIDEERFDGRQIQDLYASDAYPLERNGRRLKRSIE